MEDWVKRFNDHRKKFHSPSCMICVDESISRWCGLGGSWIDCGLPMCASIDRKPEDGLETQDACDGVTGIMMSLKLVKTAAANEE